MIVPFRVNILKIISGLWIAFSFYWWLISNKDISQFIFGLGFGLLLYYIAHNENSKLEILEKQKDLEEYIGSNEAQLNRLLGKLNDIEK